MTACLIYLSILDPAWQHGKNIYRYHLTEDLHTDYTEMLSTLLPPLQFPLTRLNPSFIPTITIKHDFQRKSDLILRGSL